MADSIFARDVQHSNPIPAASRIGNIIASGLISGRMPGVATPDPSFAVQCRQMFANMEGLIEAAGGDLASILRVTVWVDDRSRRDEINEHWTALFPDPEHRPARLTLNRPLDGGKLVECEIIAVLRT